jgi:hypothetical protein
MSVVTNVNRFVTVSVMHDTAFAKNAIKSRLQRKQNIEPAILPGNNGRIPNCTSLLASTQGFGQVYCRVFIPDL